MACLCLQEVVSHLQTVLENYWQQIETAKEQRKKKRVKSELESQSKPIVVKGHCTAVFEPPSKMIFPTSVICSKDHSVTQTLYFRALL